MTHSIILYWHTANERVPDQNGVSQARHIVKIHHSGWEPSIYTDAMH